MAAEMEVGDRNPDICELFSLYNDLYFHGALGACIVNCSSELNNDTGTCHYEMGWCEILLSKSLLKVFSTADLKNALLHEMVHAFLWIVSGNKNHSDHGTHFQEKVIEINSSLIVDHQRPQAGYNITLHHDFKKEANFYRFYQWICDICGHELKKITKPSASDCNQKMGHERSCSDPKCEWHKHQNTCSGTYCRNRESPRHKEKNPRLKDEQKLEDRKPKSPRQEEKNLNLKDEHELQDRKPESPRQKEKNLNLKGEQELETRKPETLPYLTTHGIKRLRQTEGSKAIADVKTTTTTENYFASSSGAKKILRNNSSSDDDDYLNEFNPKEVKTEIHAIARQNPKGVKTRASKRKNRCTGMKRNGESKEELIAGKWREWVKAYKARGKWFKVYGDEEEYEDIEPLKNKRSERKKVLESIRASLHASDETDNEEESKEERDTPDSAPSQLDIDEIAQSPSIIILD